MFFCKNQQSIILLCITCNELPDSFRQPCRKHVTDDVGLSHLPVQHSDRPSEIYYFIPGSSHIFDKCFSLIVCYIIIFNENITGFNSLKKIYS